MAAQADAGQRALPIRSGRRHGLLRAVRLARNGIPLDLGRVEATGPDHARRMAVEPAVEAPAGAEARSRPAHVGHRADGGRRDAMNLQFVLKALITVAIVLVA